MQIQEIIAAVLERTRQAGGLKAVYFVGCGGSQAAIFPGKYLLDCESKTLSVKIYNSNEFVHCPPVKLDGQCLVICCSLKATAETVEAVKTANNAGAVTIAMTGSMETGMAQVGQYIVTYSNGDHQVYSQGNQAQVLRIAFELLHQLEGYAHYEEAMESFDQIDEIIAEAKENMLPAAKQFAQEYQKDTMFYVLACGALQGTGYTMVSCHLLEMQRLHAAYIHSGEYFHGPFETTDRDVPMILLMNIGRNRPLDERALRFLETYAPRRTVIDVQNTGVAKLPQSVAEYFSSVVMIPIERFFVSQLAIVRNRSMDDRVYMWKVPY